LVYLYAALWWTKRDANAISNSWANATPNVGAANIPTTDSNTYAANSNSNGSARLRVNFRLLSGNIAANFSGRD
jgi:hypothetical protein